MTSTNSRGAAFPAFLLHRLPSLNRIVPKHPPPGHRLRRAGRNVAVRPDGDPLRVNSRRVGLEVTELLLLLGVQPPFNTSLFWRLVKAAVLVQHRWILARGEHSWKSRLTHDPGHLHCPVLIQAFKANRNVKELKTCFCCTER